MIRFHTSENLFCGIRKKLTFLYRENKTNLEEQGYNNFFLALGFLEWKEADISDKVYSAPLILVPMNIEREKVSDPFTVYWNGDDIRSNLSLIYKLKDQGVDIEEFEEFDDVLDPYSLSSSANAKFNYVVDTNKFYKSRIRYGLVAVNLSEFRAEELTKDIIPEDKLKDYLVAPASCYPAFKKKDIEGEKNEDDKKDFGCDPGSDLERDRAVGRAARLCCGAAGRGDR